MQQIIEGSKGIAQALHEVGSSRYLLVCDASFPYLSIKDEFSPEAVFDGFTPNPLYEDVCRGVQLFNEKKCDAIVAIGGGSTIDVAKCIKLYCRMDHSQNYLQQEYFDSGVPLIAIPTTAGTGSESTRYAVIYYDGKKQSVTHESIIPNYAILEPSLLRTLPLYQKKCTMMDALFQGIESWWSVNSTDESKQYSRKAVETIVSWWKEYIFDNSADASEHIMRAANLAGRAINITQTTAPHAMSYKLTSLYGIPHGHAVAACLPTVWQYMIRNIHQCIDPRGVDYLGGIFDTIAIAVGSGNTEDAPSVISTMMQTLEMQQPSSSNLDDDLSLLAASVNVVRLRNNPVAFSESVLHDLYAKIVKSDI